LAGVASGAFIVDPPALVIKSGMGETMAWVDITHSGGPRPVAVEISVLERLLDVDGEFQTTGLPESSNFTVFPSQFILQPRERARVQVVYKGPRVTADKAYHLYSREVLLPIASDGDAIRTGVNTAISYYSAITLETGRPGRLTFVSSRLLGDGRVEVVVENKSNGRVPVEGLIITIGGRERIRNFTGRKNSVMPGQTRRFTFEYDRVLTAREVAFGYQ
jgi:P pilus assembly chaperone PapD